MEFNIVVMKDTYTPEHHISLYNVKTEYLQSILQIKSTFRNIIEVYKKMNYRNNSRTSLFGISSEQKINKNVSGEMFTVTQHL